MGVEMSRQGGGIGTRGIGETNTERMKRHWAAQMKKVEEKLEKMSASRERQLNRRQRAGLKTVSLVGYTNAGKTSLYNRLAGKRKFARNLLFATLDPSVGKLFLPQSGRTTLVSDTIGFIQGLPPDLLQAFTSTLMESIFAEALVQVVDAADDRIDDKLVVVDEVLAELGLDSRPRILVFNKIDSPQVNQARLAERYNAYAPLFVSSKTGQGVEELVEAIDGILR
jgi:GTP-binding protein HflX